MSGTTLYNGVPIPPPPGTDLSANRNPQIIVADAICYALVTIAVALRYISRKCSGAGLWLDDYLVIPAFILSTGQFIVENLVRAWGKHVWVVGLEAQEHEMQILFAMEFFYLGGLSLLQCSILAFYWRIFGVSRFRYLIWAVFILVQAWMVTVFVMWLLQCVPLSKLWNILEPGYCNLSPGYLFGSAFVHIFIDAVLLFMPIPIIWKLQMPLSQKALVLGTFMVGSFVMIVSCLRLYYVWIIDLTSIDLTWNFTDTILWSVVELHMSVVAVCLPTLRPIYRRVTTGSFHRSEPEATAGTDLSGSGTDSLHSSEGKTRFPLPWSRKSASTAQSLSSSQQQQQQQCPVRVKFSQISSNGGGCAPNHDGLDGITVCEKGDEEACIQNLKGKDLFPLDEAEDRRTRRSNYEPVA